MNDHVQFDGRGNRHEAVWFHEDDYCQRELLPRAVEGFAREEVGQIQAFSEAHRAPGGVGWTDVYVQKTPPASMHELKIGIGTLSECVPSTLQLYERVTTGYSTQTVPAERTVAWGRDRRPLIFADFDDLRVVRNVWFEHFGADFAQDVRAFLVACAARWDVILADWAWTQVVDPRDVTALNAYLELRAQA